MARLDEKSISDTEFFSVLTRIAVAMEKANEINVLQLEASQKRNALHVVSNDIQAQGHLLHEESLVIARRSAQEATDKTDRLMRDSAATLTEAKEREEHAAEVNEARSEALFDQQLLIMKVEELRALISLEREKLELQILQSEHAGKGLDPERN